MKSQLISDKYKIQTEKLIKLTIIHTTPKKIIFYLLQ